MQYGLDSRAEEAQDAFWWTVLQELRGRMHVELVSMDVEERRPSLLDDPIRSAIRRDIDLTVRGRLLELVRPFPPAASSMAEIGRILAPSPAPSIPSPSRPSSPPVTPPSPPPPPPMDGASVRFSLLELD